MRKSVKNILGLSKKSKSPKSPSVKKSRKKKETKRTTPQILNKHTENPIISPRREYEWESWQTFNPGVISLNDNVHFLYRAIGGDGLSRFGYASSQDGFKLDERLAYPVYEHHLKNYHSSHYFNFYSLGSGGSFGGAEDPRLVHIDEGDTIYMTYTACDEGLRVALTSIGVKDFLNKKWRWKSPALISPPGEVHKNWVLFPEKIDGKYAILHSVSPRIAISYFDNLEFDGNTHLSSDHCGTCECENGCHWESSVRGAGPPPIKTRYGWLLLYHAMDKRDPGKYKVGAMLLDLDDPTKIAARSPEPILEPEEIYEYDGFKAGVVYASGAVVKDGKLLVYYGAADSYIGVAYADFNKFLEELMRGAKPKLEKKSLRKNKKI